MELRNIKFAYALDRDDCENRSLPYTQIEMREGGCLTRITLNKEHLGDFRQDILTVVNKYVHESFQKLATPKIS